MKIALIASVKGIRVDLFSTCGDLNELQAADCKPGDVAVSMFDVSDAGSCLIEKMAGMNLTADGSFARALEYVIARDFKAGQLASSKFGKLPDISRESYGDEIVEPMEVLQELIGQCRSTARTIKQIRRFAFSEGYLFKKFGASIRPYVLAQSGAHLALVQ